jgi:hypothetical protein
MAKQVEPSCSDELASLLEKTQYSRRSSPRSAVTLGAVATRRRFSLMVVSVYSPHRESRRRRPTLGGQHDQP